MLKTKIFFCYRCPMESLNFPLWRVISFTIFTLRQEKMNQHLLCFFQLQQMMMPRRIYLLQLVIHDRLCALCFVFQNCRAICPISRQLISERPSLLDKVYFTQSSLSRQMRHQGKHAYSLFSIFSLFTFEQLLASCLIDYHFAPEKSRKELYSEKRTFCWFLFTFYLLCDLNFFTDYYRQIMASIVLS